jgi:hypothetical protein
MSLRIHLLPERLAVSRLPADAAMPSWIRGTFTSITRTRDELSVVCDDDAVPDGVQAERNWRAFQVEGPIPFDVTGVAAALANPLASAGISIFLLATFDTDYVMVRERDFQNAADALRGAGHVVIETSLPAEAENDFL